MKSRDVIINNAVTIIDSVIYEVVAEQEPAATIHIKNLLGETSLPAGFLQQRLMSMENLGMVKRGRDGNWSIRRYTNTGTTDKPSWA